MAKIYMIRHAEAAPALPGQQDKERPLTERGIEQAKKIALPEMPTEVFYPISVRGRETALNWGLLENKYSGSFHCVPFISPHGFGDDDMRQDVFDRFLRACVFSDGTHSLKKVVNHFGKSSDVVNALALAARMAWTQIARVCGSSLQEDSVLALFGHDIFLQAISYYGLAGFGNHLYPLPNGKPNDGDYTQQPLPLGGVLTADIPTLHLAPKRRGSM